MQLKSKRRKLAITSLDREGLSSLMNGEYGRVCELCGVTCDEGGKAFLATLVTECLAEDPTDEGGTLWNTLWIGSNTENGGFIGAIRMMGRPTESRELTMELHPVEDYHSPSFAYAFSRVCEWAFNHRAVYYIRLAAKGEEEEAFLRRFGFVQNQADGLLEREKNQSSWTLICTCIGLGTGVAMGDAFGGTTLGLAVGAMFGAVAGWYFDHRDVSRRRKGRETLTEKEERNDGI